MKDLENYKGEWIVIDKNEIISHGNKFLDVVKEAKKKGIKIPHVIKVSSDSEIPFIGGN